MWVTMEIEALRELSEEELIDRLGEVRQFTRDLKEENPALIVFIIFIYAEVLLLSNGPS